MLHWTPLRAHSVTISAEKQCEFDRDELLVTRLAEVFDAAARWLHAEQGVPRCTPQMRPVLIHASTKSCVLRRVKLNSAPEARISNLG